MNIIIIAEMAVSHLGRREFTRIDSVVTTLTVDHADFQPLAFNYPSR